jgi:succinoglycan biosynthesis transport protein ExoP
VAKALFGRRRFLVDSHSRSSEPFRTLRLAIEVRPDAPSVRTIVFTSTQLGDGKSTVAANYALVASSARRRVLLIDGDLRNPSLHEFFGVPRSPGLVEALRAEIDPFSVVQSIPSLGGLSLMAAGSSFPRSADLLASPRMARLLEEAAMRYELVVVDSSPVSAGADARGLASHPGVEVVMVVKRPGKRRLLLRALRELDLIGANVLGLVVNREGHLASYDY